MPHEDERTGDQPDPASPEGNLAHKINRLFEALHDGGGPRSNDEVAEAISRSGTKISSSYLWLLRTGRRDNPGKHHLEAIAAYFRVPPGYFFNEQIAQEIGAEMELLAAMRKAGVRELALRAADLSPDSVRAIAAMVEHARLLERLEPGGSPPADRRRPPPPEPGG